VVIATRGRLWRLATGWAFESTFDQWQQDPGHPTLYRVERDVIVDVSRAFPGAGPAMCAGHAAYLTDRETDRRRLPAGAAQPHSPTTPARITSEYDGNEYGGLPVKYCVFSILLYHTKCRGTS